jgi:HEAT repeat protein
VAPTLGEVLANPYGSVLADWLASGTEVVGELHDELAGTRRAEIPGGLADREIMDNLSAVVAAVAEAHPDAFLSTFEGQRWRTDTFVIGGLGHVGRPEATDRLLALVDERSASVRMYAVIGLGRVPCPASAAALAAALDDTDYLVRYHALEGLAAVGDDACRPALDVFLTREDVAPVERQLAQTALDVIHGRGHGTPG